MMIPIPTPLWSLFLSPFAGGSGGTLPVTRAVASTNKHESDGDSADSWSSGTGSEFPSSASVFETYVKPVLNESSIENVRRLARYFENWFQESMTSLTKMAERLYKDGDIAKAKIYSERQIIVARFYEKYEPLIQDHHHQLIALEERKTNQLCGFDEGDNTSHSTTDLTVDKNAAKPPRLNVLSHNKAAIDNTKSVVNVVKPPPPVGVNTSTITENQTQTASPLVDDVDRLRALKKELRDQINHFASGRHYKPDDPYLVEKLTKIQEVNKTLSQLKAILHVPKVADLDQNRDGHQHADPHIVQTDDLLRQYGDLQKESQSCDKEAQDSVFKFERIVEEIIKTRGQLRYLSGRVHELEDSYEDLQPPLNRALRAGLEGVEHLRRSPPRDRTRLVPQTKSTDRSHIPFHSTPKEKSQNRHKSQRTRSRRDRSAVPKRTRRGDDPPSDPSNSSGSSSGSGGGPNKPPEPNKGKTEVRGRSRQSPPKQSLPRRPIVSKKPEINKFKGDDISDATLWISSFVDATRTMQWTDEDRASNFKQYLEGTAAQWYKNHFGFNKKKTAQELLNPTPIKWETIVNAFVDRFLGREASAQFISEYNNFAPEESGGWLTMCQRYRTVADMAYSQLEDIDKVQNLATRFGSKNSHTAMKMLECQTLSELEKVCRSFDLLNVVKPFDMLRPNNVRVPPRTAPQRIFQDNRQVNQWSSRKLPDSQSQKTREAVKKSDAVKDNQKSSEDVKQRSPFNVRCLNCWGIGHYMRDCEAITGNKKNPYAIAQNFKRIQNRINIPARDVNIMDEEIDERGLHEAHSIAYYFSDNFLDDEYEDDENGEDPGDVSAITTPFSRKKINVVRSEVTKPCLYVDVSGVPARALCDTGSDYTHVSGHFANELNHLERSHWRRPKLYAVNGRDVTPRHQINGVEISHQGLNFKSKIDVGIIREQSYDLIIGMDFMNAIGLVIVTPLSTLMLVSDLEKFFRQDDDAKASVKKLDWQKALKTKKNKYVNSDADTKGRKDSNKIEIHKIDLKSFEKEVNRWSYQPAEDIKTVMSELDFPSLNEVSASDEEPYELRCHTKEVESFGPREIKLIPISVRQETVKTTLLTEDPRFLEKGWQVQEVVLPTSVKDFQVYVRNNAPVPRILNRNASVAVLEEVDEMA